MKLFVGNLPFSVTEEELHNQFAALGNVLSAKIITDRESGRPRGFGFVEMASEEEARSAIAELDGKEISGRQIAVSEAKPQQNNGGGGRGRDNRGGGGRGRY
ncbi:MAG: RNA-binding protein [Leptospirales bacterium]|nr:RNA-binding protein [Leptospirales bacterium]